MTILNVLMIQAGAQPSWLTPALMLGMVVVFYFFMIRPQAQKAKEQKKFIDELQKGTKVVTNAGIHAIVNKINEDGTLQIEVSTGIYLKIEKSAISMEMTVAANKSGTPATTK